MKRQSKAEEALRAQSRMIQGEIEGYINIKRDLESKIAALMDVKNKIESEIARLERIRRNASEQNKRSAP